MTNLCESCGTFHAHDGKFCPKGDAHLMSKKGEQYRFVSKHQKKAGKAKKDIKVDRYPRRPGQKKTKATEAVRHAARGRQKVLTTSDPTGLVPVGQVIGEAGDGWKKTGGGWPSKDPPSYEIETSIGLAKLFQRKKGRKKEWILDIGGKEHVMPKKAQFGHAEAVISRETRKAGKKKSLGEAKEDLSLTDDEIFELVKEVVAKDPKNRATEMGVVRLAREKRGLDYATRIRGNGNDPIIRRLDAMASGPTRTRRLADGRVRGTYKIVKVAKGKGLEFRKVEKDNTDVLVNGEDIGSISRIDGERITTTAAVNVAYTKVYDVDLYTRNVRPKSDFKKIADAKRWVKANLDAIMKDLIE